MLGQDVSGGGHTMPPSSSGFQNGQLRPDVWQQAQALINTAPVGLRPANVGIKALEVYISRQYVRTAQLCTAHSAKPSVF